MRFPEESFPIAIERILARADGTLAKLKVGDVALLIVGHFSDSSANVEYRDGWVMIRADVSDENLGLGFLRAIEQIRQQIKLETTDLDDRGFESPEDE